MQTRINEALVALDDFRKNIFSRKRPNQSKVDLNIFINGIKAGLSHLQKIRSVYTAEEAVVMGRMAKWRINDALRNIRHLYRSLDKTDKKTFILVAKMIEKCLD